jgi:hypothetical protein
VGLWGAIAADRGDLFVTHNYGNTVTEINAATGALVRVISGSGL